MARNKKLPNILNEEEQNQLLEIFNTRYPTQFRNKVMIKSMLDLGLRLSETINLKWNHINLTTGKTKVKEGKGAKDRILYLNDDTLQLIKKWRERQFKELEKRLDHLEIEYIFTTLKNKQLNPANIRKMVYNYSEKANINKNISPHTFRHTFATDLYRETGNIRLVQKSLG
ncbi:MAG: tyrosine-type recombinase/integrase, partial [Bacillota bacterium]